MTLRTNESRRRLSFGLFGALAMTALLGAACATDPAEPPPSQITAASVDDPKQPGGGSDPGTPGATCAFQVDKLCDKAVTADQLAACVAYYADQQARCLRLPVCGPALSAAQAACGDKSVDDPAASAAVVACITAADAAYEACLAAAP